MDHNIYGSNGSRVYVVECRGKWEGMGYWCNGKGCDRWRCRDDGKVVVDGVDSVRCSYNDEEVCDTYIAYIVCML